jgi:trimeric autotransporter adhesin
MKTITLQFKTSVNRVHVNLAFAATALACFALLPVVQATCREGCLTNNNTVLGDDALLHNTGADNTAIGFQALFNNTSGSNNTATGADALFNNTGDANTATGSNALLSNTNGLFNTATGSGALETNTSGYFNTATGVDALLFNTLGYRNTAIGVEALYANTTGFFNTATGVNALRRNKTGINNTAFGNEALRDNTTGKDNIALGASAGLNLTHGDHNIDIGNKGVAAEANTVRIGMTGTQTATFIAGISGVTVPTGVPVIIDTDGHLGTTTSSARYKEAIQPMDEASEAILALKPVTFRYKKELDPKGIPQFGLVAEQVGKINLDLVARDEQGKPYTVRYDAVNAMLLNEFLKEHRKVEEQAQLNKEQQAALEEQTRKIQGLTATVKEQAALIQKVSDRLDQRLAKKTLVADNQ